MITTYEIFNVCILGYILVYCMFTHVDIYAQQYRLKVCAVLVFCIF